MKGATLSAENGLEETIIHLLKKGLEKECFGALLIPVKVPAGDSFTYLLLKDTELLGRASPLPPIMPVQGARALYRLTRLGKPKNRVVAIMRPCEIRGAVELFKLEQVALENIFLISIDCPGALPLKDYLKNPEQSETIFKRAIESWESEAVRPVCKTCDRFSIIGEKDGVPTDIHIGILGQKRGIFLIPTSLRGKEALEKLGITAEEEMENWEAKIKELEEKRKKKKVSTQQELKPRIEGPDKLLEVFGQCIGCHNCMRVCPICYCRQCYFDSEALKLSSENYLMRAERKGGLRFPSDTLLFHLGRMSHMILSCVACGTCEDACPVSIPVAQIFSLVAERTQNLFNYVPGRNMDEPLPLVAYKEEEFREIEKPYVKTYELKEEEKQSKT